MNRLEALADAVMNYEGWKPGSVSYVNRNPGNLKTGPRQAGVGVKGFARYVGFIDGYMDLLDDLRAKCAGRSHSKLGSTSTLLELFQVYAPEADHNFPRLYAWSVARYCSRALRMDVRPDTLLIFFVTGLT